MTEEVADTVGRVWHWSADHSMQCRCYTSRPCFKTLSFRDLKACRGSRVTGRRTAGQCKGTGAHMSYGDNWSFVWFSVLIKLSCKMWPHQLSNAKMPVGIQTEGSVECSPLPCPRWSDSAFAPMSGPRDEDAPLSRVIPLLSPVHTSL